MKTIKFARNKNFSGKPSSLSTKSEKQMETDKNSGKSDIWNHTSNASDHEVCAKTVRRKSTSAYKLTFCRRRMPVVNSVRQASYYAVKVCIPPIWALGAKRRRNKWH